MPYFWLRVSDENRKHCLVADSVLKYKNYTTQCLFNLFTAQYIFNVVTHVVFLVKIEEIRNILHKNCEK